jgi:hypothetical protein
MNSKFEHQPLGQFSTFQPVGAGWASRSRVVVEGSPGSVGAHKFSLANFFWLPSAYKNGRSGMSGSVNFCEVWKCRFDGARKSCGGGDGVYLGDARVLVPAATLGESPTGRSPMFLSK